MARTRSEPIRGGGSWSGRCRPSFRHLRLGPESYGLARLNRASRTAGDPVWQRVVRLSDGRTLVTDGGLAIDAAIAKPAQPPTTEASGKVIEGFLARQGPEVPISDLRSAGTTYTAPNGMKLNATYVDYLRRILGERVSFRMGGDLEPIVIVASGKPAGVLMAVRR